MYPHMSSGIIYFKNLDRRFRKHICLIEAERK